MKTKEPKNSAEAFNKVLSQFTSKGIKIQNFTSDNGNEFKGEFSTLLEKQDIKHYTHEPGTHNTLGIIERFNRTVRDIIRQEFIKNSNNNWIDHIPKLIKQYNNSQHTSIKSNPIDIWNGKQTFSNQPIKVKKVKQYEVGDNVRIRKKKGKLEKLDTTYSKEIFIITKKNKFSYRVRVYVDEKGVVLEDSPELEYTVKPNQMKEVKVVISKKQTRSRTRGQDEAKQNQDELKQQRKLRREGL
jgi:hypothetical protein